MLSSTKTIGPILLPMKHPHTICDKSPSRCFPTTFFGRYFSFKFPLCLQIQTVRASLSFLIADSSDQITLAHCSAVQSLCSFAHANHAAACFSLTKARFTALQC